MMGSNHIMNGSGKLTRRVNLMKVSESQGVNNNLNQEKLTCLKNQDRMTIQSVVANRNGMFETLNGYGVNMNSVTKAT
jgi:hypothetical protein